MYVFGCGCAVVWAIDRKRKRGREREREGERIKDKGGYRRLLEATYIPGYKVRP